MGHTTPDTLRADPEQDMPPARIENVSWMSGSWRGEAFGGVAEEVWSPPSGASLMGMYKQINDGEVAFYEFMAVVAEAGSLVLRLKHFDRDLSGWEEKDVVRQFPLVRITPAAAYFDGITYRLVDKHTLAVVVLLQRESSEPQEVAIRLERVLSPA